MNEIKIKFKIIIDICMAITLLLLMSYNLIGAYIHEWLGVIMFLFIIMHNILNLNWYRNMLKGRYTAFRIFQLILDITALLSVVGLMVSGIMLSRYIFSFISGRSGNSFARTLHMLSAYWGLIIMSIHLGIHVNMMIAVIHKTISISKTSRIQTIILRIIVVMLCGYGVLAFVKRKIGSYMFLQTHFVFFDFNEHLIFFFLDYIVVMAMFACVGYYISSILRKISRKEIDR